VTAVHHPWTRLSVGIFTSLLNFFKLAVDLQFFCSGAIFNLLGVETQKIGCEKLIEICFTTPK
jgi:hypothetical protein